MFLPEKSMLEITQINSVCVNNCDSVEENPRERGRKRIICALCLQLTQWIHYVLCLRCCCCFYLSKHLMLTENLTFYLCQPVPAVAAACLDAQNDDCARYTTNRYCLSSIYTCAAVYKSVLHHRIFPFTPKIMLMWKCVRFKRQNTLFICLFRLLFQAKSVSIQHPPQLSDKIFKCMK